MNKEIQDQSLRTASCPSCGVVGSLREIVYGMPGPDFDFNNFIVGGCCVTDEDPTHGCRKCEWTGFVSDSDNT